MQLELLNVCKSYNDAGKTLSIINNLSFTFPKSGLVAIIGRSGVGKSTLLQIIGGLDQSNSGDIIMSGKKFSSMSSDQIAEYRGENIGFIFQSHYLLRDFTAVENVAMPLILSGVSKDNALVMAYEQLTKVGLQSRGSHFSGELSGGEQQRVAIARALVHDPTVILADEPTGSLDVVTALEIRKLLRELIDNNQKLMIVVTHSQELAQMADFVYEMQPGGHLLQKDS